MKPYRTFPLRSTLVATVITGAFVLIAVLFATVGAPAYVKAKKVIHQLWVDIAEQVGNSAMEKTVNYFQNAPITLKIIRGLVEEEQLRIDQFESIGDICYRALKENPPFSSVFYFKPDGAFSGVLRVQGGVLGSERGSGVIKNYKLALGDKWVQTEESKGDYDVRKRPFWNTALHFPDGGWSDPYSFATTQAVGYTYVIAQKINGIIVGYWGVDFEISQLSQFLESLKPGKEGVISIVTDQGKIIATSSTRKNGGIDSNEISYTTQFPKEIGIPWSVNTTIGTEDVVGPIRHSALSSLPLGVVTGIICLMFLGIYFGRVSKRLKEFAWEMDEVGNLQFNLRPFDQVQSRIREINAMNHALRKMKIGLESFSKYVPIDVVKKLIFSGFAAKPGAEKKEVTVLFADMVNFTTLAESLQPPQVVEIIEEFLTMASKEVHKEKGIIDKFMGDAVMALWGVPEPLRNGPLAACRTALAMKKMAEINPRIKHRIGINTGHAMIGNFGSEERLDYTAIGDSINIAARLEKFNKKYGTVILIGPVTALEVEHIMLVRPVNSVLLEGRAHSLVAYELLGEIENMPKNIIEAVAKYRSALNLYEKKAFKEAAQLFDEAHQLFGKEDLPSKILAEQCRKKNTD